VKNQHLPVASIAIEIVEATVEIPEGPGENGLLPGARELSTGRCEFKSCLVELDSVAAVGEDVDPKRRSLKPFRYGYMAVYVDNLHKGLLPESLWNLHFGTAFSQGYGAE
jgi:hypothetical protein